MSDNRLDGIRRGQAYNHAVEDCRKHHKEDDERYFAQRFIYHLNRAGLYQQADIQQLATIIDRPKVLTLFKELNDELSNGS